MLSKLIKHSSNYSIGNILVTLAGVISLPIYTRIFTVADYGVMNLISMSLLLLAALGKLGIQHAVVRFYSEVATGKNPIGIQPFFSTIFWGMAATGLILTLIWLLLVFVIPEHWWHEEGITGILFLTSVLILIRNINSSFTNILRAQQRSKILSMYSATLRYVVFGLTLFFIFYVIPGLYGFYTGVIVGELAAVIVMFVYLKRQMDFLPSQASWPLYRQMLVFGIPMIGFEMSGIVLNLGDRFVLKALLGDEAVGLYSVAYNLCDYVQLIIISAISQAVSPMYIRLWEEKGEVETRNFVQQSLHFYLLLAAAVVAGLAAVSEELLPFVASDKFASAAPIIPYVIGGMLFDGAVMVFGAGLYIFKQSKVLMTLVAVSAVINIVLCFALIPIFGINGAAISTLISYFVFSASAMVVSRRYFPITIPWLQMAKFTVMAIAMYFIVMQIKLDNILLTLLIKIVIGVVSYGGMVAAFDRKTRSSVLTYLVQRKARTSK